MILVGFDLPKYELSRHIMLELLKEDGGRKDEGPSNNEEVMDVFDFVLLV